MRLRAFAIPAVLVGLVASAACSGGEDATATATPGPGGAGTPVPTATPLARVPDPIIVSGDGAPSGGGTATEGAVTYTVESGDTLGGIAARFGVDLEVIQEANDLDGVDIFIGQELTIPRQGTSGSPGAGEATPTPTATATPPSGVSTYTVQAGDTAFGIALEFDTTVEALEEANDVGPGGLDDLQIGQVIQLPRPQ